MALLPSLISGANVAVVGASGGIGAALVELLAADERVAHVLAFSRSPGNDDGAPGVSQHPIDLVDEQSICAAAGLAAQHGPLDLVLVASGILHRGDRLRPERRMSELHPDVLTEMFAVNTIGPAIVAKHFLPRLRRGHKTVFAALSARVGSIGDNRLGGWASYRASKAGLNMLLRTLAIEQARNRPQSVVVALHPGTVATRLSAPFTGRVPAGRLQQPEVAARNLLRVVEQLRPGDTGGFLAWDGSAIEY